MMVLYLHWTNENPRPRVKARCLLQLSKWSHSHCTEDLGPGALQLTPKYCGGSKVTLMAVSHCLNTCPNTSVLEVKHAVKSTGATRKA